MKRNLFWLLLVLVCVGCVSPTARNDLGIFNAGLRGALDSYDQSMAAQRTALRFASGRTVSDCAAYLDERRTAAIDEAVNNRIVAQEYLVCDAMALLRQARPVGASAYRPDSYGRELLQRLDLRGFPSSLRPMIDDNRFTLADLAAGAAQVEPYAVTVETADWRYRFEVIADVHSDRGAREWLIWFSDEAKNGNYRAYETLVIPNPGAAGLLEARTAGLR